MEGPRPQLRETGERELRTVYGTELVVVYVSFSVKVDTLVTVSVAKLVVVRVWSMVTVVGLTFVVFKLSQQYIPSGSWKRLQVSFRAFWCLHHVRLQQRFRPNHS